MKNNSKNMKTNIFSGFKKTEDFSKNVFFFFYCLLESCIRSPRFFLVLFIYFCSRITLWYNLIIIIIIMKLSIRYRPRFWERYKLLLWSWASQLKSLWHVLKCFIHLFNQKVLTMHHVHDGTFNFVGTLVGGTLEISRRN